MKSFTAQQDSTGAYINICQRRFRRAWQLSAAAQNEGEKRGRNRPPYRHAIVDIEQRAFRTVDGRTTTAGSANTHQRTRQGLCGPCSNALAITANADTVQTHKIALRNNAAFMGISNTRPHDGKSREGAFARVSNHVFHTVEAVEALARHSQQRDIPPGSRPPFSQIEGGRGDFPDRRIIDLSIHFRGPVSRILGGPALKNLGRPVRSAALTQRSRRIRRIGLAAPAAISESWRGHVAMSEHLIRLSTDWAAVFRARKAELGYSDAEVDHRAGLPAGYCNKILNAKKKPGAKKIEQLCQGLDLEVVLRPVAGLECGKKSST